MAKQVTITLLMTVPDEYDSDDVFQMAQEITIETHHGHKALGESVEDWEVTIGE